MQREKPQEEHLKRIGCGIRIMTETRYDKIEVTTVKIIPDTGWKLDGTEANRVIKLSTKDLVQIVQDSNIGLAETLEIERIIEEAER